MKRKEVLQKQLIPTEGFVFDEATHSYFYDGRPMSGVTSILSVIAKPALIGWAAKMACESVREKATVAELDGVKLYTIGEADLVEAQKAHAKKKDDAAQKGTDLHALVEAYVGECVANAGGAVLNPYDPKYQPIEKFIGWATENNIRFIASEKQLYSKELWVAGTCDLVFEKDGKRFVGDIKTYAKIWDRVPFFQCAGYSIMVEEMTHADLGEEADKIDGYCVLRLSKDGTFEAQWSYDIEGDRKAFLACVELYRALQNYKRAA
jgi:hypothetical protein